MATFADLSEAFGRVPVYLMVTTPVDHRGRHRAILPWSGELIS